MNLSTHVPLLLFALNLAWEGCHVGSMSPTQHSSPGWLSLPKAKCPGTEPIDPRTVMRCHRDPNNILMHPPKQFISIHYITCTHLYSHLKPTLMYNLLPPIPRGPRPTRLSPFPSLRPSPCPPQQAPTLLKSSPRTPPRLSLQDIPLPTDKIRSRHKAIWPS